MTFLEQANKDKNSNGGTYVLTVAIAFVALVVGQSFSELLANNFLGYSLANIPNSADLNIALALLLLPFSFLLLALILCIKFLHKRPVLSLFTTRKTFDWKRFVFAFLLWGSLMGIALIISILNEQDIVLQFDATKFIPLFFVSILIMPIQTTAEEVFFRGYLFQVFGKVLKKGWIAIILTGVLFGLLHWANPEVAKIGDILLVFYIGAGIFFGILTHMDDGLELGMGYHAVNNIFASIILTNSWQSFQTDALFIDNSPPTFGVELYLTLFILQPLLLFVFSKVYKWKDWKKKLFL
ncbi:MAG TPA: CPBP family intramembrane metalloprotease [Crocinitomicaceae bacterium]|nr:CPBP family intramembrane metalloprotease [Crocinitomicaceae bacterium]